MKNTKHVVIHTGGNIYNDIISDFDNSGRVIVVSESGIFLFASDRDYQCGCEALIYVSSPECDWESRCDNCGMHGDWQQTGCACQDCGRGLFHKGNYEPINGDYESTVSLLADTEKTITVRDTDGAYLKVLKEHN